MEFSLLPPHHYAESKPDVVIIPNDVVINTRKCIESPSNLALGLTWGVAAGAITYVLRPLCIPYLGKTQIYQKLMVPTASFLAFVTCRFYTRRVCFQEATSEIRSSWREISQKNPYLITQSHYDLFGPTLTEAYNVYACLSKGEGSLQKGVENVPDTTQDIINIEDKDRPMESYESYSPFNDSSDLNSSAELDLTESPTVNKKTTSYVELRARNRAKVTETPINSQGTRQYQQKEVVHKTPAKHTNAYGDEME